MVIASNHQRAALIAAVSAIAGDVLKEERRKKKPVLSLYMASKETIFAAIYRIDREGYQAAKKIAKHKHRGAPSAGGSA